MIQWIFKIKLLSLQKEVEKEIEQYLETLKNSPLATPIAYALSTKGKRLRPILTKIMAASVGTGFKVNKSALAIELFRGD